MRRGWLASLVLLLTLSSVDSAAYELTYTCGELGTPCSEGERPKQVFWWRNCVSYYVNESGSEDFNGLPKGVIDVIHESFKEWNDAEPGFQMEYAGKTNVAQSLDGDGNIINWQDKEWPYASTQALALTIISFDTETGEILDADIEFNSVVHEFSYAEEATVGTVDFQSTLTHEIGHFLGLDHSQETEATMFGRSSQGQSKKRTLHQDDLEGFAAIYPDTNEGVCKELPDFLEGPRIEDEGCCSTLSTRGQGWPIFLIVIGMLFWRSRRRI